MVACLMAIWTVVLKAPSGGLHFEEVEADELPNYAGTDVHPDYVLLDFDSRPVARFPRSSVAGIYLGRRRVFEVTVEPKDDDEGTRP